MTGFDAVKYARELKEAFLKKADELGVTLMDGYDESDFPALYEAAVFVVEKFSKILNLTGEQKKELAVEVLDQHWREVQAEEWFIKLTDDLAKRIRAFDIPRLPDWAIDPLITGGLIRLILKQAAGFAIDAVVRILNRLDVTWDI